MDIDEYEKRSHQISKTCADEHNEIDGWFAEKEKQDMSNDIVRQYDAKKMKISAKYVKDVEKLNAEWSADKK